MMWAACRYWRKVGDEREPPRRKTLANIGDEDDQRDRPRRAGDGGRAGWVQSRVSSATAFLAQSSSTNALPAVVAAMRAAVATLLNARGRPRLALWRRATASPANNGSVRPTRAR